MLTVGLLLSIAGLVALLGGKPVLVQLNAMVRMSKSQTAIGDVLVPKTSASQVWLYERWCLFDPDIFQGKYNQKSALARGGSGDG